MGGMVIVSACKYLKGHQGREASFVRVQKTPLQSSGSLNGQISFLKKEELAKRQSASKINGLLRGNRKLLVV